MTARQFDNLEEETKELNDLPWWRTYREPRWGRSAKVESAAIFPRIVFFEEARQRGGTGLQELFGHFQTARTFNAAEAL